MGSQRKRGQTGGAMLELLLIFPIFLLLFFATYMLGDFMFIQGKAELAARYASWKRNGAASGRAKDTAFADVYGRKQVEITQDVSAAGRYPFDDMPEKGLSARQLNRGNLDQAGSYGGKVASIVYDGNDHDRFDYFGATSSQLGGGWVVEQRSLVRFSYHAMGLPFLPPISLGAYSVVLNSKTTGAMFETGKHPGANGKFKFRDTRIDGGGGDNFFSAETAAMFDHLLPPDPMSKR